MEAIKKGLAAILALLLIFTTSCRQPHARVDRLSAAGHSAKAPKIAFAIKVDTPPVIDAKPDDACWKNKRGNDFFPANVNKPLKKQSSLSLCYDNEKLYVMIECNDPDALEIKKNQKSDADNHYVVMILMPGTNEYFRFAVNPANTQFSYKKKKNSNGGFEKDETFKPVWESSAGIEEGKWTAEFAIPFKELETSCPSEGSVWKGNFYREEKKDDEYSSYFQADQSFYDPAAFGNIVFGNFLQTLRNDLFLLDNKASEVKTVLTECNAADLIPRLDKAKAKLQDMKAGLPDRITEENKYNRIREEITKAEGEIKGILFDCYALKDGYFIWRKNSLAPLGRERLPLNIKEDIKEVNMVMGRNEIEMCSLVIANFKKKALLGRVVVSRFKDGKGKLLPPDFISMRGPAFIEMKGNRFVDDPLPALNEVNEVVALPRENKEVILFIDSWKLQPGEYSGIADIRPYEGTNSFPVKTVKLNISVLPVDLGNDHLKLQVWELDNYVWTAEKLRDFNLRRDEFSISKELWPAYIKDMVAHRVNVFQPSCVWIPYPVIDAATKKITEPLNPSKLQFFDYMLSLYKQYGKKGTIINFGSYPSLITLNIEKKGLRFPSPEWKDALRIYYKALIDHIKSRGFTEDDLMFYPYDEINNTGNTAEDLKKFCEEVKIMKEISPKIKVFLTISGTGSTKEELKHLEDALQVAASRVDVWCPYFSCIDSKYFDFIRNSRKPIWSYANVGYSSQRGIPLNIEKYGWLAWSKGLQGIGSWSYNCWISDGWDDFDNFASSAADAKRSAEAYVYWGPKGPVTSRRWEAMREAMEDHELLYVFKSALDKAKEKKIDVAETGKWLKDSVDKILNCDDPDVVYGGKIEILKEIVKLQY